MMEMIIIMFLVVIIATLGLVYISTNVIKTKKYQVKNSKLPEEFNGLKIAHISDVHSKIFGKDNSGVIDRVIKENPDVVIMSGDIIDKREEDIEKFVSMYKKIYERYPTYYSIGNHERKLGWKKYKKYLKMLQMCGVHVIINGSEKLIKNDKHIIINALKFRENMQPKVLTKEKEEEFISYMKNKLKNLDTKDFNILIAHDPENFKMYKQLGVDLVFSGHVHGGLIRFGKICLLSPRRTFFPKYSYGKNTEENTTIITSAGMGKATLPIRLFNRPEIVIVTLYK
ncbi:MAG: metallophosphoesterase [Clostridia bacterium]|nr:metallophosphoesterase [Clostridia bacterium]